MRRQFFGLQTATPDVHCIGLANIPKLRRSLGAATSLFA